MWFVTCSKHRNTLRVSWKNFPPWDCETFVVWYVPQLHQYSNLCQLAPSPTWDEQFLDLAALSDSPAESILTWFFSMKKWWWSGVDTGHCPSRLQLPLHAAADPSAISRCDRFWQTPLLLTWSQFRVHFFRRHMVTETRTTTAGWLTAYEVGNLIPPRPTMLAPPP